MDLITALPPSTLGNDAVIVFVDRLSKMTEMGPCKSTVDSAGNVALFTTHVVCTGHGFPLELVCDRDPRFTSKFFREYCDGVGITLSFSTAYHPQSDGQTERMNTVLVEALRNYVGPTHRDWEERLPLMKLTINNAFQESIQNTPLYLNQLRHPRMPYSIPRRSSVPAVSQCCMLPMKQAVDEAKRCILLAQERQKKYADMHKIEVRFAVGEAVWLSTRHIRLQAVGARKLYPRWVGPFLVKRKLGTFKL